MRTMKLYRRLFSFLRPYQGRLAAAIVCMGGVAALNALRIYLVKPLQDRVFIAHDMEMLRHLLWWVPAISVALGLFSYAQNYLMASIGQRAVTDIRKQLFDHLQSLSMDFFSANASGKMVA